MNLNDISKQCDKYYSLIKEAARPLILHPFFQHIPISELHPHPSATRGLTTKEYFKSHPHNLHNPQMQRVLDKNAREYLKKNPPPRTPGARRSPALSGRASFNRLSRALDKELSVGLDKRFLKFEGNPPRIDLSDTFKRKYNWNKLSSVEQMNIIEKLKEKCLRVKGGRLTFTPEFESFLERTHGVRGNALGSLEADFQDLHNSNLWSQRYSKMGKYLGRKIQTIKNNKIKSGLLAVGLVGGLLYMFSGQSVKSSNPKVQSILDAGKSDASSLPTITNCEDFIEKVQSINEGFEELKGQYDSNSKSVKLLNKIIENNKKIIEDASKLSTAASVNDASALQAYASLISDFNARLKINAPKLQRVATALSEREPDFAQELKDVSKDMGDYILRIESSKSLQAQNS